MLLILLIFLLSIDRTLVEKLITVFYRMSFQEFKLNPSAKVFSPSFTSSRQMLAAATPVNSSYRSHSATEAPTGIPVFESKSMLGGSSLSSKVHHNNLSHANCGLPPQYVQPVST